MDIKDEGIKSDMLNRTSEFNWDVYVMGYLNIKHVDGIKWRLTDIQIKEFDEEVEDNKKEAVIKEDNTIKNIIKTSKVEKRETYWKVGLPFIVAGLVTIPGTVILSHNINKNNIYLSWKDDKQKDKSYREEMIIGRDVLIGFNIISTAVGIIISAIPKKKDIGYFSVIPTTKSIYASYSINF